MLKLQRELASIGGGGRRHTFDPALVSQGVDVCKTALSESIAEEERPKRAFAVLSWILDQYKNTETIEHELQGRMAAVIAEALGDAEPAAFAFCSSSLLRPLSCGVASKFFCHAHADMTAIIMSRFLDMFGQLREVLEVVSSSVWFAVGCVAEEGERVLAVASASKKKKKTKKGSSPEVSTSASPVLEAAVDVAMEMVRGTHTMLEPLPARRRVPLAVAHVVTPLSVLRRALVSLPPTETSSSSSTLLSAESLPALGAAIDLCLMKAMVGDDTLRGAERGASSWNPKIDPAEAAAEAVKAEKASKAAKKNSGSKKDDKRSGASHTFAKIPPTHHFTLSSVQKGIRGPMGSLWEVKKKGHGASAEEKKTLAAELKAMEPSVERAVHASADLAVLLLHELAERTLGVRGADEAARAGSSDTKKGSEAEKGGREGKKRKGPEVPQIFPDEPKEAVFSTFKALVVALGLGELVKKGNLLKESKVLLMDIGRADVPRAGVCPASLEGLAGLVKVLADHGVHECVRYMEPGSLASRTRGFLCGLVRAITAILQLSSSSTGADLVALGSVTDLRAACFGVLTAVAKADHTLVEEYLPEVWGCVLRAKVGPFVTQVGSHSVTRLVGAVGIGDSPALAPLPLCTPRLRSLASTFLTAPVAPGLRATHILGSQLATSGAPTLLIEAWVAAGAGASSGQSGALPFVLVDSFRRLRRLPSLLLALMVAITRLPSGEMAAPVSLLNSPEFVSALEAVFASLPTAEGLSLWSVIANALATLFNVETLTSKATKDAQEFHHSHIGLAEALEGGAGLGTGSPLGARMTGVRDPVMKGAIANVSVASGAAWSGAFSACSSLLAFIVASLHVTPHTFKAVSGACSTTVKWVLEPLSPVASVANIGASAVPAGQKPSSKRSPSIPGAAVVDSAWVLGPAFVITHAVSDAAHSCVVYETAPVLSAVGVNVKTKKAAAPAATSSPYPATKTDNADADADSTVAEADVTPEETEAVVVKDESMDGSGSESSEESSEEEEGMMEIEVEDGTDDDLSESSEVSSEEDSDAGIVCKAEPSTLSIPRLLAKWGATNSRSGIDGLQKIVSDPGAPPTLQYGVCAMIASQGEWAAVTASRDPSAEVRAVAAAQIPECGAALVGSLRSCLDLAISGTGKKGKKKKSPGSTAPVVSKFSKSNTFTWSGSASSLDGDAVCVAILALVVRHLPIIASSLSEEDISFVCEVLASSVSVATASSNTASSAVTVWALAQHVLSTASSYEIPGFAARLSGHLVGAVATIVGASVAAAGDKWGLAGLSGILKGPGSTSGDAEEDAATKVKSLTSLLKKVQSARKSPSSGKAAAVLTVSLANAVTAGSTLASLLPPAALSGAARLNITLASVASTTALLGAMEAGKRLGNHLLTAVAASCRLLAVFAPGALSHSAATTAPKKHASLVKLLGRLGATLSNFAEAREISKAFSSSCGEFFAAVPVSAALGDSVCGDATVLHEEWFLPLYKGAAGGSAAHLSDLLSFLVALIQRYEVSAFDDEALSSSISSSKDDKKKKKKKKKDKTPASLSCLVGVWFQAALNLGDSQITQGRSQHWAGTLAVSVAKVLNSHERASAGVGPEVKSKVLSAWKEVFTGILVGGETEADSKSLGLLLTTEYPRSTLNLGALPANSWESPHSFLAGSVTKVLTTVAKGAAETAANTLTALGGSALSMACGEISGLPASSYGDVADVSAAVGVLEICVRAAPLLSPSPPSEWYAGVLAALTCAVGGVVRLSVAGAVASRAVAPLLPVISGMKTKDAMASLASNKTTGASLAGVRAGAPASLFDLLALPELTAVRGRLSSAISALIGTAPDSCKAVLSSTLTRALDSAPGAAMIAHNGTTARLLSSITTLTLVEVGCSAAEVEVAKVLTGGGSRARCLKTLDSLLAACSATHVHATAPASLLDAAAAVITSSVHSRVIQVASAVLSSRGVDVSTALVGSILSATCPAALCVSVAPVSPPATHLFPLLSMAVSLRTHILNSREKAAAATASVIFSSIADLSSSLLSHGSAGSVLEAPRPSSVAAIPTGSTLGLLGCVNAGVRGNSIRSAPATMDGLLEVVDTLRVFSECLPDHKRWASRHGYAALCRFLVFSESRRSEKFSRSMNAAVHAAFRGFVGVCSKDELSYINASVSDAGSALLHSLNQDAVRHRQSGML